MKKALVLLLTVSVAHMSFMYGSSEFNNISRLPEDSRVRRNCENYDSFRMPKGDRFILKMACKDLNEQFDRLVHIAELDRRSPAICLQTKEKIDTSKDYIEQMISLSLETILPAANLNTEKQEQEFKFITDLAQHMAKQNLNN